MNLEVNCPGRQLSDDVRLACFDQVNRSTRRGALAGPVAALMLVVIFGHTVPIPRMIAWAVTVTVVTGRHRVAHPRSTSGDASGVSRWAGGSPDR